MFFQMLAEAAQQKPGSPVFGIMPILIVMAVFMFFMTRSQKKQQQKHQSMIDHIVKGTKVILASGICGVVDEVKDNEFVVEIADKVKVRVVKNGIANVVEEEKAEEKK